MILQDARLIDGTGRVWERAEIVISGSQIASVASEPSARPEAHKILSLAGQTVIPGLINCHTHICLNTGLDPVKEWFSTSLTENVIIAERRLAAMLRAGITTVRDLGGVALMDVELKRAIESGLIAGPRLLVSGKVLTMTGGHAHAMGCEADGADEIRRGAREQIKAGADIVKVMATGGVMTQGTEPGAPQLTEQEMSAAVEEALKAGRGTAAHAQATAGIINAVRAGVASIEHGFFLSEEAIELMLARDTYFVPTLTACQLMADYGEEAGVPQFMVEKSRRVIEPQRLSVQNAYKAGVVIAAGNDGGTPLNPHEDIATELELLVEVGIAEVDALAAVTVNAARLLGMGDTIGTVEPGKVADLVVLGRDPLGDIGAVRDVQMVVQAGKIVSTG